MPIPFRTELRRSSAPLSGEGLSFFALLARGEEGGVSARSLDRAAAHEDETFAYLIAAQLRTRDLFASRAPALLRFLESHLEAADREGRIWTPVLDAFAEYGVWQATLEGLGGAALEPVRRRLEGPRSRALRLVPWLERASAGELSELLAFRAAPIREVVARHARHLQRRHLERLLDQPGLVENAHLEPAVREAFARRLVQRWGQIAPGRAGGEVVVSAEHRKEQERLQSTLIALARQGALSPELRTSLLHFREGANLRLSCPWFVLVADPRCPEEALWEMWRAPEARLSNPTRSELRAVLLLHPRASRKMWEEARQASDWPSLQGRMLRFEGSVPAEKLHWFLDHQGESRAAVWAAANPGADASVHLRVLESHPQAEVMEKIASSAGARAHPEVRARLLASRARSVISLMLEEAGAEEYAELFARLWEKDPALAARRLAEAPPPEGCRFPHALLAEMLGSARADIRLAAAGVFGRVHESGEGISPALPRRTPRRGA